MRARSRAILVALTGLAVVLAAGFAMPSLARAAVVPSVISTTGPAAGRSVWTYKDVRESSEKYEGGYAAFDEAATGLYTQDPHGGYNTTTNKCQVCHAVHRSESAYYLLRADSQADACSYCHVGSAHSSTVVYDGNPDGVSTPVGHRMGASPAIPESTTYMTLETITVTGRDAQGGVASATVSVRRADTDRNQIFRLRLVHGQSAAGAARAGYQRIGPTALTCLACHQPHNAVNEVWSPMAFPDNTARLAGGYKLLRRSPSGSVEGPDGLPYGDGVSAPAGVSYTTDGMRGSKQYLEYGTTGLVNADNAVRAPQDPLVAGATFGPGLTTWDSPALADTTYWAAVGTTLPPAATAINQVNQYALSPWCADCHNLAIGGSRTGFVAELGMTAHESTLTHPVPMVSAGNGPGQCYTCHRGDLAAAPTTSTYDPARAACERCHYGTGSYASDPKRLSAGGSDWPHSAETSGAFMLGAWSVNAAGAVQPALVTPMNADEVVCARCHTAGQKTHGHVATVASSTISGTLSKDYFRTPGIKITYSGQQCGECHLMDLMREHSKPSSAVSASACSACHTTPRDTFAGWGKTCSQGGCHATYHTRMHAKHTQTAPTSCSNGGEYYCHQAWDAWDVAETHADAWYDWTNYPDTTYPHHPYMNPGDVIPKDGCAICHNDPKTVPTKVNCVDCHYNH